MNPSYPTLFGRPIVEVEGLPQGEILLGPTPITIRLEASLDAGDSGQLLRLRAAPEVDPETFAAAVDLFKRAATDKNGEGGSNLYTSKPNDR